MRRKLVLFILALAGVLLSAHQSTLAIIPAACAAGLTVMELKSPFQKFFKNEEPTVGFFLFLSFIMTLMGIALIGNLLKPVFIP